MTAEHYLCAACVDFLTGLMPDADRVPYDGPAALCCMCGPSFTPGTATHLLVGHSVELHEKRCPRLRSPVQSDPER